jgi:hypothetical protein
MRHAGHQELRLDVCIRVARDRREPELVEEKRSASRYSCVPPRVMNVGQTVTECAEPHGCTMHMQSDYGRKN